MAVRPRESVARSTFPRGRGAKAKTVLGFVAFPDGGLDPGYRPRIRVVLTVLPRAPDPLVARWANAIPLSSEDTRAVRLVPKKPRFVIDTLGMWPSIVLFWTCDASRCGM